MKQGDTLRQIDAQLKYFLRIDPDVLNDEEWAMSYNELVWVRRELKEVNSLP